MVLTIPDVICNNIQNTSAGFSINFRIQDTKLSFKAREIAKSKMLDMQNGVLDKYFEAAKQTAEKHGVKVCDVYSKWKRMHEYGVDTTNLLANHINHPTEKMNWQFAYSLVETMFD